MLSNSSSSSFTSSMILCFARQFTAAFLCPFPPVHAASQVQQMTNEVYSFEPLAASSRLLTRVTSPICPTTPRPLHPPYCSQVGLLSGHLITTSPETSAKLHLDFP